MTGDLIKWTDAVYDADTEEMSDVDAWSYIVAGHVVGVWHDKAPTKAACTKAARDAARAAEARP